MVDTPFGHSEKDTASARGVVRATTLVLVVVGVVVGVALAPQAWSYATQPDGDVAVVEIRGSITSETASGVVENLREARQNDSIEAVVLDIDSPGGTASASEQLYLAVKRTAAEMPVTASVTGTAASGSYYAAIPSEEIYVTPASVVGSVGVRATLPASGVAEGEVVTGPDKNGGATEAEVYERVETLRRAFVGAVFAERGDRIDLSREELSHAKVYSGVAGVEHGLADEVGGVDTAVAAAADEAGLDEYRVTRMDAPQPSLFSQFGLSAEEAPEQPTTEQVFEYRGVDTVQYLMLHGTIRTAETETEVTANANA